MMLGDMDNASILGNEFLEVNQARYNNKWLSWGNSVGYLFTNEFDKSLDWLARTIDMGYLHDISTDIFYEPLYDHPRFQELVEKQKKKREEVMALVATYNFPEPEDL